MRLDTNQPIPDIKPTCLGCRTSFTLNQELSPLTSSYFDMIEVPVKKTQRVQILRVICAFLNSKGGHIYLGVEKKNIQVRGIMITTKQQDEFKFYIKELIGKVHPKVDLSNREQVETVFVPVLTEGKQPTGKAVIKIIVKQGQLDRVYTYVEKIKVSNPKGGEPEEFELRYGFMPDGNTYLRLEGIKLIDEIVKKAKGLGQRCRFHQGCNPAPLEVDPSVKSITFQGFESAKDQNTLNDLIKKDLYEENIAYDSRYNERDRLLILEFHTENDTTVVQKLLNTNLQKLRSKGVKITFEGIQFNTYLYKKFDKNIPEQKEQKQQKQKRIVEIKDTTSQENKRSKDKDKVLFGISNYKSPKRDQLFRTIKQQLPQNLTFGVRFYIHSATLQLKSEQSVRMIRTVIDRLQNKNHYTNNVNDGQLAYGKMTGQILVYGVYEKSKDNFRGQMQRKFGDKLQKVRFANEKGKLIVVLKFGLKDVNEALDKLITDNDPNLKKLGKESKMGYILECE